MPAIPSIPSTPAPRAWRGRRELPEAPGADVGDPLRGEWPETLSGKRITLTDHSTVDDAVEEIAKAAGWSASLNTGRVGDRMLVLRLEDVPVEEALRATLSGTGLVATRRGKLISVAPAYGPVAQRSVLSGFDKPSGKNFSGDFSDLDGRDALLQIGKAAGISIVLPPGPLGKVTGHFKDVPVEEALKAVLQQAGLQASRDGSVVTVSERDGAFGGRFEFRGELGPAVEDAMRDAKREAARAQRDLGGGSDGKDMHMTGTDAIVEAGHEARDVVAVRGNVIIRSGASARDVVAVLGTVTLEPGASVRQAVAIMGDVRAGPGASVERDAISIGGKVQVDPSADVGGQRQSIDLPRLPQALGILRDHLDGDEHASPLWGVAWFFGKYLLYLAFGLLLMAIFPRRIEAVGASLAASPGRSVLTGVVGWLAVPVLLVLLAVTLVGLLLWPVVGLAVAAAVVMGFTSLSALIGRSLPPAVTRGSWVLQLAVGTAVLLLLTEIPFLGVTVLLSAGLFTFGAVIRTRFGQPPPDAGYPGLPIPPPVGWGPPPAA
jgi:hypothetical protein